MRGNSPWGYPGGEGDHDLGQNVTLTLEVNVTLTHGQDCVLSNPHPPAPHSRGPPALNFGQDLQGCQWWR